MQGVCQCYVFIAATKKPNQMHRDKEIIEIVRNIIGLGDIECNFYGCSWLCILTCVKLIEICPIDELRYPPNYLTNDKYRNDDDGL